MQIRAPRQSGIERPSISRAAQSFARPSFQTPCAVVPHGGGYSTVGDLVKFARALRSGKLLRPENVQLLTTAKPKLGAPQYGYGFFSRRDGRLSCYRTTQRAALKCARR
jgi:hypothetical protein